MLKAESPFSEVRVIQIRFVNPREISICYNLKFVSYQNMNMNIYWNSNPKCDGIKEVMPLGDHLGQKSTTFIIGISAFTKGKSEN